MADFYDLLGVGRDADADTLKRAYRRLARQYHPDINKEAGAEDRFKEIGRAYEVLSDPQTRARYDQFGEAGLGGAAGAPDMGDMGDLPISSKPFSRDSAGPEARLVVAHGVVVPSRGMTSVTTSPSTSTRRSSARNGRSRFRILKPVTSAAAVVRKPGSGPTTCGTCGGAGQVRRATRTPFGNFTQVAECPNCGGTGQVISDPCSSCSGRGVREVRKKLRINIPAGVDTGTRLRVSGEGNAGLRGGPAGDLYVFLTVRSHPKPQT